MGKRTGGWSGISTVKRGFDPDLLPTIRDYFSSRIRKLGEPNPQGWATGLCPFHNDKNPSFSVNFGHGGFVCRSCGESGGGIVNFHKKLRGIDFKAACKELGAWRGSNE